ncbi:MAG TPA: dihydrolipoyl dehydrogenase [Melioribacteraceae bacterium]|nr:dihydrolipoyl dehydrogenase [Melioribacteraceae bacterium]
MSNHTQLAVIGAGPGGYAASFLAADLGMQVTLINLEKNPGGVCLYRGCIPSKALLHVAKLLTETEEAKNWGVYFEKPKIDLDKLRSWKESVVNKLTGGLGMLSKQRKINYILGKASFKNSDTLFIEKLDGTTQELTFDNVIIATGSVPTKIPGLSIDSPLVMDSTGALELNDIPGKLLVIGGGYIGLELGSVYSALGSKVTVVEMTNGLLPGADRDMAMVLSKSINKKMESVLLSTKVTGLEVRDNKVYVKFEGEKAPKDEVEFDKVLISIGRRPVTAGFGLENTKVKVNERGFIEVNEQLKTADPKIYAIGDVVGNPMLAHKASAEGKVAVESIAGHKVAFEPNAIPAVVFTDPELAWAGLTETEAKEKGIKYEVAKFPWGASGRATTIDRNEGLTKLIVDPETERILGVGIVGVNAGEMIAEGVVAIEMAATAKDLALSIHPHPTLSESVMESAEVFFGQSTHMYRPKK